MIEIRFYWEATDSPKPVSVENYFPPQTTLEDVLKRAHELTQCNERLTRIEITGPSLDKGAR